MNWIWIEFHRFPIDKLLDIFFSKSWLLKIKTERPGANRLLIDIMKRCQIWVAESLVNCKPVG